MALTIVPTGAALAAEVRGVDLGGPVEEPVAQAIRSAWLEHIVLLFRDQQLDAEGLIRFGRLFGELHRTTGFTYGAKPDGTPPEIEIISNQPEDSVPSGARPSDEAIWHTDMSMTERPASASILYALEVPGGQGRTSFANLYAALEALPAELLEAVRGRRSIHDAAYTAMHEIRAGYQGYSDPATAPGERHPILRSHPESGRQALFLGRKGYGYIEGYSSEDSTRLLGQLWEHMTAPAFVWTHDWRNGDVVLWDNRCCTHMREAFDPGIRRRLIRVTAIGERPAP